MPSTLFSPFRLQDLDLANRAVVAPMCQCSAVNGVVGDWHMMHLGSYAIAGAGLVLIEATGVEATGRITHDCTGLYSDACEEAFARVLAFCRSVGGSDFGIQLGHAGRKGSTTAPWLGGQPLGPDEDPWTPDAPSPIPYLPNWETPHPLDDDGLARVRDAFAEAARRAARLGLDVVEVHMAHGYLLHQFLSPLSNRRDDAYGGSFENRVRFPLEVFDAVRAAFPADKPVLVRISATDWIEGGWDLEQSIALSSMLKERGCAGIHVSSGGLRQDQAIEVGPGYQVRFAAEIRRRVDVPVIAVGQVTTPIQAETILKTGQADLVALARGMLWDPRWMWKAALEFGEEIALPPQYARCNPKLAARPFVKR